MTKTGWKLWVVFVLIVAGTKTDDFSDQLHFTCLRPTTKCESGRSTCNESSGKCACNMGFRGLQCQVFAPEPTLTTPSCHASRSPCVHGQCYDRGMVSNGTRCICNSGYYGLRCSKPMLSVQCQGSFMRIFVRPWGYEPSTWQSGAPCVGGMSAVLTKVEEFVPRTPEGWNQTGLEGFVGEFDYVGDPGAGNSEVLHENSTHVAYSRRICVRYSPAGEHPTDDNLQVTCIVLKPDSPTVPPMPGPTMTVPAPIAGPNWTCQRPTTPCLNGSTCNSFTKRCVCVDGFSGLQCDIPTADLGTGNCKFRDFCVAGQGLCYSSDVETKCTCHDQFYGPNCQHPMVLAECDANRMIVNLFPYGYISPTWPQNRHPFIQVNATTACEMQPMSDFVRSYPDYRSRGWGGFATSFAHVGDICAGSATVVSETENSTVYLRKIEVNYLPAAPHITDQLIEVQCAAPKCCPATTSSTTSSTPTITPLPSTSAALTTSAKTASTPTTSAPVSPTANKPATASIQPVLSSSATSSYAISSSTTKPTTAIYATTSSPATTSSFAPTISSATTSSSATKPATASIQTVPSSSETASSSTITSSTITSSTITSSTTKAVTASSATEPSPTSKPTKAATASSSSPAATSSSSSSSGSTSSSTTASSSATTSSSATKPTSAPPAATSSSASTLLSSSATEPSPVSVTTAAPNTAVGVETAAEPSPVSVTTAAPNTAVGVETAAEPSPVSVTTAAPTTAVGVETAAPTEKITTATKTTTTRKTTRKTTSASTTTTTTTTTQRPLSASTTTVALKPPLVSPSAVHVTAQVVMPTYDGFPVFGAGLDKPGFFVRAMFTLQPSYHVLYEMRLESCVVADHYKKSFSVVKNSCLQKPTGYHLYRKSNGIWVLIFKVSEFYNSVCLRLSCRVSLCNWGDTYCTENTSCPRERTFDSGRPAVTAVTNLCVKSSLLQWWLLSQMLADD